MLFAPSAKGNHQNIQCTVADPATLAVRSPLPVAVIQALMAMIQAGLLPLFEKRQRPQHFVKPFRHQYAVATQALAVPPLRLDAVAITFVSFQTALVVNPQIAELRVVDLNELVARFT